ncbi:MAG: sulfite exporter TauE/SafE family protein [Burkholderiales bacterium]
MSPQTFALASATVLIAAFVQGSAGFGFALITAPVLGLMAPEQLPVCVLLLMLPLNAYVAWRERAALDVRSGSWITAGRIVGTLGGLWVLTSLSLRHMNILIGASTIGAASVTLLMPTFTPARGVYLAAGVVTGITETATGIGGPPLALVYQHHPAAVMRSTIAICFLAGEVISLAFLWYAGLAQTGQLLIALQLAPALAAGVLLSRFAHRGVNARVLRLLVMLFSIASGAVLLLRA